MFQIISDLHLEFVKAASNALTETFFEKFLPKAAEAKYLILAGDVCTIGDKAGQERYHSLMKYCSRCWEKTFVVAGNHEYYGTSKTQGDAILRRICNMENIVYLNQDVYQLPEHGLTILGTTLWSNTTIPVSMNDYNQIYAEAEDVDNPDEAESKNTSTITHYDTLVWHHNDVHWLTGQIDRIRRDGTRIMCITHHMPSKTLIAPRWEGHPINAGFASDLDYLVNEVDFWVCGHTHTYTSTTIGKCQVHINPRGYPGENVYRTCLMGVMDPP